MKLVTLSILNQHFMKRNMNRILATGILMVMSVFVLFLGNNLAAIKNTSDSIRSKVINRDNASI